MKVTKINIHCEFNSFTGCTEHYLYFSFEDGSKTRVDGVTKWSADLFEKLGPHERGFSEEYESMIIGWHRYIQAFTPEIAREYAKRPSPYEEDNVL